MYWSLSTSVEKDKTMLLASGTQSMGFSPVTHRASPAVELLSSPDVGSFSRGGGKKPDKSESSVCKRHKFNRIWAKCSENADPVKTGLHHFERKNSLSKNSDWKKILVSQTCFSYFPALSHRVTRGPPREACPTVWKPLIYCVYFFTRVSLRS